MSGRGIRLKADGRSLLSEGISVPAILLSVFFVFATGQRAAARPLVGINFVEQATPAEWLDQFSPLPGIQVHPWLMTSSESPFLTDGGLAGFDEPSARRMIFRETVRKFRNVESFLGRTLAVDFALGPVSGEESVNCLIGSIPDGQSWFGLSKPGAILEEPTGQAFAFVSVDRIAYALDAQGKPEDPLIEFNTTGKVVQSVAGVICHEIGHLVGLRHVCAELGSPECTNGPLATDPFDLMATGNSGLGFEDWVAVREFTTVPGTQAAGLSSAQALEEILGACLTGDTNGDGDVDNADIATGFINFTGSDPGSEFKKLADGDTDRDGDVDNADLARLFIHFTGAGGPHVLISPDESIDLAQQEGISLQGHALQAVPEPCVLVLLLPGILIPGKTRSRIRKKQVFVR